MRRSAVPAALVMLAAAYFLVRGPWRALHGPMLDFRAINYTGLRTFALGGNPYRLEDLVATSAALPPHLQHFVRYNPTRYNATAVLAYPPGYFLLSPIGLLEAETAARVWVAILLGAFFALLAWSWRLFPDGRTMGEKLLFLACGLALAPVHTDFGVGNPGLLFAALGAALFVALQRKAHVLAGVVLGLLMMRPAFGVPAALLVAVLCRWRTLIIGGSTTVVTSLPAVWQLGAQEAVFGFVRRTRLLTSSGMQADESLANPQHFQIVNLRSWLLALVGPGWAELLTVVGLAVMLAGLFRYRLHTQGNGAPMYWTLAACLLCLTMYHRFYDASLLAVAVAAAFELYRQKSRWAWFYGAALAPFAVPGSAALHVRLGELAHQTPLLEPLVVRHDSVALVALAGASLAALGSVGSRGSGPGECCDGGAGPRAG